MSAVRLSAAALCLLAAVFLAVHPAAQRADTPVVRILSPGPGEYATGATPIRVELQPADAARDVIVSVDGRQVCAIAHPPYVCDWNAGTAVTPHQIRVVANLVAGGRVVATTLTKGLDFVESVDVDVVQITATVSDGSHFVSGLPRQAFHVFEDGKPQTITHFESENVPLELTVAADISSSMTPAMPKLKSAVKGLLQAVPANAHVTVMAFNDRPFVLSNRAVDQSDAMKAVDQLNAGGFTALYDVIIHGIDLAKTETGRKAMIVFSDGEDQGSHATLADVERRLEASDLTLYMIGLGRGTTLDALKKIMTRLTEPTGGRALFTERIDTLREAFDALLEELSHQYMLGYAPTNARHDGTTRTVKVEVDGHRVRARQLYRAPLDAKK